jgi:hypothetical protein
MEVMNSQMNTPVSPETTRLFETLSRGEPN